jgi:hypothetical protein
MLGYGWREVGEVGEVEALGDGWTFADAVETQPARPKVSVFQHGRVAVFTHLDDSYPVSVEYTRRLCNNDTYEELDDFSAEIG